MKTKAKRKPRIEKRFYRVNCGCGECDKMLLLNPRTGDLICPDRKRHERDEILRRRQLKRLGLWDYKNNRERIDVPLPGYPDGTDVAARSKKWHEEHPEGLPAFGAESQQQAA